MYDYVYINKNTGATMFLFGYSVENAWARASEAVRATRSEWELDYWEYVD